jgi:hypothetical protein
MRLRITETNFTANYNWIFKLSSEQWQEAFIMNSDFYKARNMKSPISKRELDYLDKGYWLKCEVKDIEGILVVTNIIN